MNTRTRPYLSLFAAVALALGTLSAHAQDAESVLASADKFTVLIKTTIRYPFPNDTRGTSRGAGFIVDRARGWILTNAHVASYSPANIMVSFHNGEQIRAKRLYVDNHLDLAVLAIPHAQIPADIKEARLDCGAAPSAGVPVVAYGHPGGQLFSGTKGIVSGVSQQYPAEYLQTDAPINPGNSGGPLINLASGKIVGVSSASAKGSQNLNFAVASAYACPIIAQLRAGRDPLLPDTDWRFFRSNDDASLTKLAVPGRLGDALGLKAGDVIVSVNGSPRLANETQILNAIRGRLERLVIEIERDGVRQHLHASVQPATSPLQARALLASGLMLVNMNDNVIQDTQAGGVDVQYVEQGSLAEAADLSNSDVLVSINGHPVTSLAEAQAALEQSIASGQPALMILKRMSGTGRNRGFYGWVERSLEVTDVRKLVAGDSLN